MEMRKVQKTGGSTLTVSLPKAWAKDVGIESRDVLALIPQPDGTLLINPKLAERREPRKKIVEIRDESPELLMRKLIGIYMSGYTLVEIRTAGRMNPKVKERIREITRKVIGPEIIDESMDSVTIQDLVNPTDLPMTKGVRRMYLIARAMHQDAMTAFKERDTTLAIDVGARDDEVDRLFWLITKQYNMILRDIRLAEKIGMSNSKALSYLLIARLLERIGDHAKRIADTVTALERVSVDDKMMSEIVKASDIAIEIVEKAINALYKESANDANDAIEYGRQLDDLKNSITERIIEQESKVAIPLTMILESIDRTGSYGTDIAEIVINHVSGE